MTRLILFISILTIFISCDNSVDSSLFGNAAKLNSPYSNFSLYRYDIESSMAFGSGFTVLQIIPSDKKCDYTDGDFFRFDNNFPLSIKWKNKDTLLVKCIINGGGLSVSQPIRKEMQKWKDWTFEVNYYSIFSTGTNGVYSIENYQILPNSILFKTSHDIFIFDNTNTTIELDSNQVLLREFKIDTFKTQIGLSLSNYKFELKTKDKMADFDRLQPFIKQKP